jgi:hypothetical protein
MGKIFLSSDIHVFPTGRVKALLQCHSHILLTDTVKDSLSIAHQQMH